MKQLVTFWKANDYLMLGFTLILMAYWLLDFLKERWEWLGAQYNSSFHIEIFNWSPTERDLHLVLFIWLFVAATIYWLLERYQLRVSFQLKYLHINLTFFCVVIFYIFIYWIGHAGEITDSQYFSFKNFILEQSEIIFEVTNFIFWLGQLLFVINTIMAVNLPQRMIQKQVVEDYEHFLN